MSHIQKILVPMDGSPSAIAALWEAVELAEDLGAGIEVLHVDAPDQHVLA
ncbi:MAG: universal stress protein, partial [Polyangiales bacterium]